MRVPGRTERYPWNETPCSELPPFKVAKACICKGAVIIDGAEYISTDTACPVHGFEAQTIARHAYVAEPSREEEPVNMKGRDSR